MKVMTRELNVLDAPCVFCGYFGSGYWQTGKHDNKCPWYEVAGQAERLAALRDAVKSKVVPDAVSYAAGYRDGRDVLETVEGRATITVLAPPCVFCGYDGEGYWEAGTHSKTCPWFEVGGIPDRRLKVRDAFVRGRVGYEAGHRDGRGELVAALGGVKAGLRKKYVVAKIEDHVDPAAQYFVLRIDTDEHARKALWLYAKSVRKDNEALANDLINWLMETLNTPAGRKDLIRIMDEMVEK